MTMILDEFSFLSQLYLEMLGLQVNTDDQISRGHMSNNRYNVLKHYFAKQAVTCCCLDLCQVPTILYHFDINVEQNKIVLALLPSWLESRMEELRRYASNRLVLEHLYSSLSTHSHTFRPENFTLQRFSHVSVQLLTLNMSSSNKS
jgi:hypothetical protein